MAQAFSVGVEMSQIPGAQTSERISVDRLEALRCRKEPGPHKALGSKPSEQTWAPQGGKMQGINSRKTLRCPLSLVHTAEDQRAGVGGSLQGMTAPWKAGSVRLALTTLHRTGLILPANTLWLLPIQISENYSWGQGESLRSKWGK